MESFEPNAGLREVLAYIRTLPPERAREEYLAFLSECLNVLDVPSIQLLRARVAKDYPESEALTLIDGHLALRKLSA